MKRIIAFAAAALILIPAFSQKTLKSVYADAFKMGCVTIWGLHDGMSWKNGYPIPNRTNYPLLYNRDRSPKPALQAVLQIPE